MRGRPLTWAIPLIAGLVLLLTFFGGVVVLDDASSELARTGVRTTGVVVEVYPGGRFPGNAHIRYTAHGVTRTGMLVMDDNYSSYRVGDRVTVIHDRDDPDSFRTEEVANDPYWTLAVLAVPLLGGAYLLVRGVVGFAGRTRGGKRRMNGEPRG